MWKFDFSSEAHKATSYAKKEACTAVSRFTRRPTFRASIHKPFEHHAASGITLANSADLAPLCLHDSMDKTPSKKITCIVHAEDRLSNQIKTSSEG